MVSGSEINDILERNEDKYGEYYSEGFKDARNIMINRLKEVIGELKNLEPFKTSTSTTEGGDRDGRR